jgi:uncharacterized membrane protein
LARDRPWRRERRHFDQRRLLSYLLDRYATLASAIMTSVRVTAMNPGPILTWGLIVLVGILLASIPVFLGLIVVFSVLGHATWRLYRRGVVAEDMPPAT